MEVDDNEDKKIFVLEITKVLSPVAGVSEDLFRQNFLSINSLDRLALIYSKHA